MLYISLCFNDGYALVHINFAEFNRCYCRPHILINPTEDYARSMLTTVSTCAEVHRYVLVIVAKVTLVLWDVGQLTV